MFLQGFGVRSLQSRHAPTPSLHALDTPTMRARAADALSFRNSAEAVALPLTTSTPEEIREIVLPFICSELWNTCGQTVGLQG